MNDTKPKLSLLNIETEWFFLTDPSRLDIYYECPKVSTFTAEDAINFVIYQEDYWNLDITQIRYSFQFTTSSKDHGCLLIVGNMKTVRGHVIVHLHEKNKGKVDIGDNPWPMPNNY